MCCRHEPAGRFSGERVQNVEIQISCLLWKQMFVFCFLFLNLVELIYYDKGHFMQLI